MKERRMEFLKHFVHTSGETLPLCFSLCYLLIRMGIMHNLFVPLTSEGVRNSTRFP